MFKIAESELQELVEEIVDIEWGTTGESGYAEPNRFRCLLNSYAPDPRGRGWKLQVTVYWINEVKAETVDKSGRKQDGIEKTFHTNSLGFEGIKIFLKPPKPSTISEQHSKNES